jgi:hypothetical protein
MDKILATAPLYFIPQENTNAYRFLFLISDGKPHAKSEILFSLGDDPRSARQALTCEAGGNWLIHNIGDGKAVYQLDERHLSGDRDLDMEARVVAQRQLKDRSYIQCQNEINRLAKAKNEQLEAATNYAIRFEHLNGQRLLWGDDSNQLWLFDSIVVARGNQRSGLNND